MLERTLSFWSPLTSPLVLGAYGPTNQLEIAPGAPEPHRQLSQDP